MFDARFWMSYYHHMKTQAEKELRESNFEESALKERFGPYYGNPETVSHSTPEPQEIPFSFVYDDDNENSDSENSDNDNIEDDFDPFADFKKPEERTHKKYSASERFDRQYELECLKERTRNSNKGYSSYSNDYSSSYSNGYSSSKKYESLDDFLDSYDK